MKNAILVSFFALSLATCTPKTTTRSTKASTGTIEVANRAYTNFKYTPGQTARVSAHRGGGDLKGYPENCIESFAYLAGQIGTKASPLIIECDIDLTKDSVMVMMHDATLDRTTTGTGKLIEQTYAQVQQYKLEDNFGTPTPYKIPTLEEVLRWGRKAGTQRGRATLGTTERGLTERGPIHFTLDVKRNVRFEKIVEMVRRTGTGGIAAVITYNAPDAARLHKLAPELMISVTIRNQAEYDRLRELGIPDNRMIAFVGTREPDKALYDFLHQKGIACILGTLGNLDKQATAKGDAIYREFAKNGADIMSTDRPLEVARAVK